MKRRHSGWKWPICTIVALSILLVLCFAVPSRWIAAFFAPSQPRPVVVREKPLALRLIPEPVIVPERVPLSQADSASFPQTVLTQPRWWTAAWHAHLHSHTTAALTPAPAESVEVAVSDLLTTTIAAASWLSKPDSSLATRLALLKIRNQEEFRRLVPLLNCLLDEQRYREMLARKTELFGEFLLEE